jgi:tetratricopeptide (TPR) repeat protein
MMRRLYFSGQDIFVNDRRVPSVATLLKRRMLPPLYLASMLALTLTSVHRAAEAAEIEPPLSGAAYTSADRAYRAYAAKDYQGAIDAARETLALRPDALRMRLMVIYADSMKGQNQDARREAQAFIDAGLLDRLSDTEAAYVAVTAGNPALAADRFGRADAAGALKGTSVLDAGYANLNAGRSQAAVGYFERGIDAIESKQIERTPQELFEIRRAVSELDRQWGINASVGYRAPGGTANLALSPSSSADETLQAGAEAYWRPLGYLGGRLIEVYARVYDTFYSRAGSATGLPSLEGAVGVRVKPLVTQNAVFAFERIIALGNQVQPDWLARAAYSNGFGTDLRVDQPSWWTGQVYGEAGRFIAHGQNYWTVNGELGRSYRLDDISPRLVAFPYAVIGGDYNRQINHANAIGAGTGVNLRYWYREDRYHAPRSYIELSLQYRLKVSGDDRARGVFVNINANY